MTVTVELSRPAAVFLRTTIEHMNQANVLPADNAEALQTSAWLEEIEARTAAALGQEGEAVTDWTIDPDTGRSNSSPGFCEVTAHVERLIRQDAHHLVAGRANLTAGLIVAQLAHKFGMAPASLTKEGPHGA